MPLKICSNYMSEVSKSPIAYIQHCLQLNRISSNPETHTHISYHPIKFLSCINTREKNYFCHCSRKYYGLFKRVVSSAFSNTLKQFRICMKIYIIEIYENYSCSSTSGFTSPSQCVYAFCGFNRINQNLYLPVLNW